MVTHCVCFDVAFTELKRVIDATGARSLVELRAHVEFGENCGLCVPFVERIFETGETAFEVEWEE